MCLWHAGQLKHPKQSGLGAFASLETVVPHWDLRPIPTHLHAKTLVDSIFFSTITITITIIITFTITIAITVTITATITTMIIIMANWGNRDCGSGKT